MILYQDCSSRHDSLKNVAFRERGLFSQCILIEIFKNLLVGNHWTDFIITWQKCFLVDLLPRLFKLSWFIKKNGRQGGWAYFSLYIYIEKFKNFLVRNTWPISILLGRNVSLVTLYQDCSSRHDSSKNMAARGRGIFSIYIYIENFKNLLVRNRWIKSIVTWQEWCFGDLLPRLFKPSWYVKKHGRQGWELIFRI